MKDIMDLRENNNQSKNNYRTYIQAHVEHVKLYVRTAAPSA